MATTIYWKMKQAVLDPDGLDSIVPEWLSAPESERFSGLRFPKRQVEWLAGRRVAKELLVQVAPPCFGLAPVEMTVANEADGAPFVHIGPTPVVGCLSLSHREGYAAAAWTNGPGLNIGIDLEWVEPRLDVFVQDYFTAGEAAWLQPLAGQERHEWVTLIWSAKEAMLKVLRQGLRLDTRKVEVLRIASLEGDGEWRKLNGRLQDGAANFAIFYRLVNGFVLTIACEEDGETVELVEC